nr:hypothetical protein Iba_chr03eCG1110 [Ipomoea batatas]
MYRKKKLKKKIDMQPVRTCLWGVQEPALLHGREAQQWRRQMREKAHYSRLTSAAEADGEGETRNFGGNGRRIQEGAGKDG